MAGFLDSLKSLFSGGSARADTASKPHVDPHVYKEFRIYAEPMAEGAQWRMAGRIVTGEGESSREHRFIRADIFSDRAELEAATVRKARQIIDEQGMRIFG